MEPCQKEGHIVKGETGYSVTYNGKEDK